jgi:hypothetical protein
LQRPPGNVDSDRVKEGEEERQDEINTDSFEAPDSFPREHWAKFRNVPPRRFRRARINRGSIFEYWITGKIPMLIYD